MNISLKCCEFYLLEGLLAEVNVLIEERTNSLFGREPVALIRLKEDLEVLQNDIVAELDAKFIDYWTKALLGELRHIKKALNIKKWCKKYSVMRMFRIRRMFVSHNSMRHTIFFELKIKERSNIKIAYQCIHFYNMKVWKNGYGGHLWKKIAETLYQRLRGDLSPLLFIDISFSLEHNNGCALNKESQFSGYENLQSILNHKFSSQNVFDLYDWIMDKKYNINDDIIYLLIKIRGLCVERNEENERRKISEQKESKKQEKEKANELEFSMA